MTAQTIEPIPRPLERPGRASGNHDGRNDATATKVGLTPALNDHFQA